MKRQFPAECSRTAEKPVDLQSFSELPPELLLKIFSMLPNLTDLYMSCSAVCKRWNAIINSDSFLKNTVLREFTAPVGVDFVSLPNNPIAKLRQALENRLFCKTGVLLDSQAPVFILKLARVNSIQHFVESLRALEDKRWQQETHCFCNGGFQGQLLYWLVNFGKLLEFSEIISVLRFPFAIGDVNMNSVSKEPLYLYDENLQLLQAPDTDNTQMFSFWTMRRYPKGLCYVAIELADCRGNEDLSVKLLWPSQFAAFENKMLLKTLKRRYNIYYNHQHSFTNNNDSFGPFDNEDVDSRQSTSSETATSSVASGVAYFWESSSSSESSCTDYVT